MKKQDAINYFGNIKKLAEALSISSPSVSQWGDQIPLLRAFQLEKITQGKLKVDNFSYH